MSDAAFVAGEFPRLASAAREAAEADAFRPEGQRLPLALAPRGLLSSQMHGVEDSSRIRQQDGHEPGRAHRTLEAAERDFIPQAGSNQLIGSIIEGNRYGGGSGSGSGGGQGA